MANQEHVKILQQGVEAWNQWRDQDPKISPDLREANLRGADLHAANLGGADLTGATLERVRVIGTAFGDVDLSGVKGLESIEHLGPSAVGVDTIYRSKGNIPEVFLRGTGVPDDFIVYMRS